MIKNLKALLFGLLVALVLCEIVLRIYNPFTNFTKQGKLVLPANQQTVFDNQWIKQLDTKICYSRNALGFRGPMPTDSIQKLNSIITVGGSTTECRFLSDSTTWPFLLGEKLKDSIPNLWVNNAGIDGHSTFGHLLLMKEYISKLKPKYVLLLTGVNDVETEKPEQFDLMNENKLQYGSVKAFIKSLLNKTEIGATVFQLYNIRSAYKKGLIHKDVDFKQLRDTTYTTAYIQEAIARQKNHLIGYHSRLQEIISICKANQIQPILLTQPSLYGSYTDSTTGIKMDLKFHESNPGKNNLLQEQVLEEYNNVVRAFSTQVTVIDLAKLMPKNTLYYYDFIHFNKQGAAKVAEILNKEIESRITQINTDQY
ncbi:GDSL-like lipase/acylhydrolase family protein [Lacibacter cauensis]|uniref:GDSL-like lipase/acylhydrolase family protein n=1 Tax=Lacibacter cauensis TaxID=510947 RepID=A0A562SRU1_9BACT|nr:SGNH/GDSL hydrolase family protein [Lacibacter cauensis]TWI83510.1 GDSL-like lipase/acylhydrolase family protein [Lacibacter cauensis]